MGLVFFGAVGLVMFASSSSSTRSDRDRDRDERNDDVPGHDDDDTPSKKTPTKTTRRAPTPPIAQPERPTSPITEPTLPPEPTPTPPDPPRDIPNDPAPAPPGVVVTETFDKYPVRGDSIAALRADVNKQRNAAHDAYTSWYVNWSYPRVSGSRCSTGTVTVTVTVNIRVPEHRPSSSTPASVNTAWDAYARALLAHENGHRDFGVRSAVEVKRELEALRERDCAQLDTVAQTKGRAIVARYASDERLYDQSTQHGATQGARFPCVPRGAGCIP